MLRTYEEPSLGIDNHLRGLRLTARPFEGVRLKPSPDASAIIGKPTPPLYMVPTANGKSPPVAADSPSARRG